MIKKFLRMQTIMSGAPNPDNPPVATAKTALAAEETASRTSRATRNGGGRDDDELVGLALSGGGIRSATFCLGVLQAFARSDKLRKVSYLSTVSGGGYIGAWLSAWVHRRGFEYVNENLAYGDPRSGRVEAPEVTWLRMYSNYLAPRLGMLSADSMTLVATWLRNVLLNLVVVISFLAICFLVPRLMLTPAQYGAQLYKSELSYASAWLAFFLFPIGIWLQLSRTMSEDCEGRIELMNTTWGVLLLVVVPGLLTALLGSIPLFAPEAGQADLVKLALVAVILLICSGIAWPIYQFFAHGFSLSIIGEAVIFLIAYVLAIVVGVGILSAFAAGFQAAHTKAGINDLAAILSFGPPALLTTFGVVGWVIVGLVGRTYMERTREWWARMNAWFIILGMLWVVLFSLSFYSVPLFKWAHAKSEAWMTTIAGASWLSSLIATLFAKRGPEEEQSAFAKFKRLALDAALMVVVLGILIGTAAGVGLVVEKMAQSPKNRVAIPPADKSAASGPDDSTWQLKLTAPLDKAATITRMSQARKDEELSKYLADSFNRQEEARNTFLEIEGDERNPNDKPIRFVNGVERKGQTRVSLDVLLTFVCALVFLFFGWRVDVNKFSLHNMYRNRLIRCYLGASRYDLRRPHPFTGFDESDDLPLWHLQESPNSAGVVQGPVHILNAALNLTHGRNLAWQERKAASFTFSPWYCGFELGPSTGDADGSRLANYGLRIGGYRPAQYWASKLDEHRHFSLGTAMATSGAAVSAIQGKGSKPMLGFIMTLFNARLGRWSPNPLWRSGWRKSGPGFGPGYLLWELFGFTNEISNYVYLSDGGHFDNTGAYELVRRRCQTIIIVDAASDVERAMADLANLVRKCRVDFGANIDFNLTTLGTSKVAQNFSEGFVIGNIEYPESNDCKALSGVIVVIKPTLIDVARIGVDVFGYSRTSESFPQQTTVDQFFSESQFESYRRLGELIATSCLKNPKFPSL